jgi:hypothetical protein
MLCNTEWRPMNLPTHDRVKELLSYDRDTGVFTWLVKRGCARAGSIAGHRNKLGYIEIRIDGRLLLGHRLAFLMMTGSMPAEVDHRDRNKSNNSWLNLRPATHGQNVVNKGPNKNNSLGAKGVRKRGRKFSARIWTPNGDVALGSFKTLEEAAAVYDSAAKQLHGEFSYA